MKSFKQLLCLLLFSVGAFSSINCSAQKKKIDIAYHALEVSYVALNYADYALTTRGIKNGAVEANPLMSKMIDHNLMLPTKILFTGGFLYTNRLVKKHDRKLAYAFLIAGNLIYSGIVYNNYQVSLKLKL